VSRLVEGVEGVEELLLGALLAGEDVHVVEEQHLDGPVRLAEVGHLLHADGVDQLVDEVLGRDVANPGARRPRQHLVADRVEEMGLAEAGAA